MGFDKKSTLIKQVVELYRQGMTQKAIAIQVNVTETTIKEWLKEVKQRVSLYDSPQCWPSFLPYFLLMILPY